MTETAVRGSDEIGHTHADVSGGWLRASVFGAMDGLVTNISLVAGVGPDSDPHRGRRAGGGRVLDGAG